ncbi:hypothetical protein BCR42DRAFT_127948 [Absidia repens]|uniref:Amino acid permease/ SLC12A domain-containing protein n=1 Tax=Absidia repens TaxID=90262 RepID=A0A1X2IX41_9FUNG|nr:hypothetical protein BCR42DRAFT_127948 [Absidia repens]
MDQYTQQHKSPDSLANHYNYGSIEYASSSSSTLSLSPTPSLSSISYVQSDSDGSSAARQAFSNIGILANTSATFQTALQRGGPITVLLGWNLVGLLAISISLSFAEICSIYPTSGGLYIWIYEMLRCSKFKNHATSIAIASGCIYTIGNIITIGATNVSIGKRSRFIMRRRRQLK